MIYPVDSAIHPSNNWGLNFRFSGGYRNILRGEGGGGFQIVEVTISIDFVLCICTCMGPKEIKDKFHAYFQNFENTRN